MLNRGGCPRSTIYNAKGECSDSILSRGKEGESRERHPSTPLERCEDIRLYCLKPSSWRGNCTVGKDMLTIRRNCPFTCGLCCESKPASPFKASLAPAVRSNASLRLLSHITFYDNPHQRDDQDPTWVASVRRVAINKTSEAWRERVYRSVRIQLYEMECCYPVEFTAIDVVVDVNSENTFVSKLEAWAARKLRRVHLSTHRSRPSNKPFQLAWAHRESMEQEFATGKHDWFMYSEDDTFVPARALRAQLDFVGPAAMQRTRLTFIRVVSTFAGDLYLADARKEIRADVPTPPLQLQPADGGAKHPPFIVTRDCSYAAAWAYPRKMMVSFMRSPDWKNALEVASRSAREAAARGWHSLSGNHKRFKQCATGRGLIVLHLGASTDAYYPSEQGFNTIPALSAVAPNCDDWRAAANRIPASISTKQATLRARSRRPVELSSLLPIKARRAFSVEHEHGMIRSQLSV